LLHFIHHLQKLFFLFIIYKSCPTYSSHHEQSLSVIPSPNPKSLIDHA